MRRYSYLLALLGSIFSIASAAHQPVMDMAPRWDNGYGAQVRYETHGSQKLIQGSNEQSNPLGLKRYVHTTWLEGVYTFDRSKRITIKIPYIKQQRVKNINGQAIDQRNSGVGDIVLGLPLKKYINKASTTMNYSFTPSIRMPTGDTSGNYPLSDGSLDVGLSLGLSKSTPKFYQLYDLFYWINNKGKNGMHQGNELGLDVNLGWHPYHNNANNSGVFVMLDITARHEDNASTSILTNASGGKHILTGPVLVLYQGALMLRAEYKVPVYEHKNSIGNARGNEFQFGIGMTF